MSTQGESAEVEVKKMNPPSALQSAMGRERKPFTYTPGGLNLSEIKSERMAKRLMRNAMNEGVPQTPVQNIQSPTTPTTPLNVPNFNCLPVQVFPAFSLPANPKSLLRTRSTPGQHKDQSATFNEQNSAQTLPSNSSAQYRLNSDTNSQGVVNNNNVNRGPSLYTQMPSYINPVPQKEVPVQEKYSPYQFDTFQPCNDAVFMDTQTDYGHQPTQSFSYINNPEHNQETVTKRVVPPFQYNPIPPGNGEESMNKIVGIDSELNIHSMPSYINNADTNLYSSLPKPLNMYEFNAISKNSSQESYKTVESDGEQPTKPFYSNYPSYINSPKLETNAQTEAANIIEKSTLIQGYRDQSEIMQDNINNAQQAYSNTTLTSEKVTEQAEKLTKQKETGAQITMSNDTSHDIKVLEENIDHSSEPKESKLSISVEPTEEWNDKTKQTIDILDYSTDDQSEVKVVKKVKKEKQTEETKQIENGDESEAALTVKLPTKKSAAKTETKVEVKQKVLPDGTIEETKKTITKTTIDGRTEISTRTETRTIPKDEQEEEEVEEEEEEEEEETENGEVVIQEVKQNGVEPKKTITNGQASIVKKEERSETTTTRKTVVVQNGSKEEEEEEEEVEEVEEEEIEEVPENLKEKTVAVKPQVPLPVEVEQEQEEVEEKEEEKQVTEEIVLENPQETVETKEESKDTSKEIAEKIDSSEVKKEKEEEEKEEEEEEEVEEEYEEAEETEVKVKEEAKEQVPEVKQEQKKGPEEEEEEYTEEEVESEEESSKVASKVETSVPVEKRQPEESKPEHKPEPKEIPIPVTVPESQKEPPKPVEIPIHFDRVEDIEIKPIGPQESITKTEKTEITTSKDSDGSTKTEMHRIENVVVSNRITKTLDQSYEQLTQGLPTMKTYFAPNRERVEISPAKAYQPTYQTPEKPTERRHSLLLERLSMERQVPSPGQYQNQTYQIYNNQTNQSYETQRDWSQEPQAEVVNVSNVKPSTITKNQQWYQNKNENVIYNNVTQTPASPAPQQWSQPSPQSQYQPPAPPQAQYQAPAQPIYQAQHQPPTPQPQAQTYTDNYSQNYSKNTQSTFQQNSYPSYTPQPTSWGSSNVDSSVNISNQYSYQNQDQKSTQQQYSSSYVPPPWEQDPSYVAPPTNTSFFQPPPLTNEFQSNSSVPGWKPAPPTAGKFSKPAPKAYVPPAPNQSFVKPVTVSEPPRNVPGRKTYYSEYERRYISVPESTYVPGESKYQQQPNPSPQYYYDNDEPQEKVEPEWRRELREFTEKTSQTYSTDQGTQSQYQSQSQTQYQTEQGTQSQYQSQYQTETSARPPWEQDAQYGKTPSVTYTPTPTWSQTLRPNSGRERTFESDYVSQTNTLGRNRPLSYVEPNSNPLPGRARGVSVDRYNPSSYRSPIPTEHSPVQSHTLDPATAPPHKIYHNPSVPAYHSRASAEPREQPAPYTQPRHWVERASPLQSRSFKYLQWITGTDE